MDTRPLHERVLALAGRFQAIGIGYDKQALTNPRISPQLAQNAYRDAKTLLEAAEALKP